MDTATLAKRTLGTARWLPMIGFALTLLALLVPPALRALPAGEPEEAWPGTIILDPHMAWRLGDGAKEATRRFTLERTEEGLQIEVLEPGHGMVLKSPLALRLDAEQTPILVFTYRATGVNLVDSNLSVLRFWGGKPWSVPVVMTGDLICDNEIHDVLVDLRELLPVQEPSAQALAFLDLGVHAASEGSCVFTLLGLRFEPDGEPIIPPEARDQATPVTVRVTDAAGNALPDALVTLDPQTANLRVEAKTDKDGRATVTPTIPGLAGTRRALQVTKEGMSTILFRDLKDVTADTELSARLVPTHRLSGRVIDEDGKPVPHATGELWLRGQSSLPGRGEPRVLGDEHVFCDAEGRWACTGGDGDVQVRWMTEGYVQDQWGGQYSGRLSLDDLKSGKAVSTLVRGVDVAGVVTNGDGTPIANANVAQGRDRFSSNAPPETKTDETGRYQFSGTPPGELILTVTAKGHAPELIKTTAVNGMAPIDVVLREPHTFRFRVVDPKGQPLAGISFSADTWRGCRTIRQRFSSNAEGLATWDGPEDQVQFDIFARDHMRQEITVGPSADENDVTEIVMHGPLSVTIHAVDEETNEPIRQFKVVTGLLWQNDGRQQPSWQRDPRAKPGVDGQWQETFTHNYPFRVFRVEAEGHAPVLTEPISKDAGNVELTLKLGKVALEPWATVSGQLLVGDKGRAGERITVLRQHDMSANTPRVYHTLEAATDAEGRFQIERVPAGNIMVARSIRLSENATSYTLSQSLVAEPGKTLAVTLGGTGQPVVGRFVWPEGARQQSFGSGHQNLSIKPNRKALEEIEKRLIPEGFTTWDVPRRNAWLQSDEGKKAKRDLQEAYEKLGGQRRFYSFAIEPDGSFRIDNVEPGTYELSLLLYGPEANNSFGRGNRVAMLNTEVTVPPLPDGVAYVGEPLDMGELTLTIIKPAPEVGDLAPDFTVPLLDLSAEEPNEALKDAKSLSLSSLRGKYVLVNFWIAVYPQCVAETPTLKKIWEAHGRNEQFALLGIAVDPSPVDPHAYAKKNELAWPNGCLDDAARLKISLEYALRSIPSNWLIGPDGKVVAKEIPSDALADTVARALAPKGK
jgi:protocatechuate 3,4-dioxygenase beta subunit/peroxiredoxin